MKMNWKYIEMEGGGGVRWLKMKKCVYVYRATKKIQKYSLK